MVKSVQIRAAKATDWSSIVDILECCGLPTDVVGDSSHFFQVAVLGGQVVGCACTEKYDETVVVRSVAVTPEHHGQHITIHLVGTALTRARAEGCTRAVLITAGDDDFSPPELELPEEVSLSADFVRRFGISRKSKEPID
ncbi:GNAT family N-acetyltransferase [Cupriavidus sp. UYPR2.512]|uniref:GNAT family N-acetyltransferase n=1 Tax=Cupriavidus sp. UYPR2.512 TaxID=1080187 RepID=UPI0009DA5B93|nr:GNAT family N-acetyltransferase [Cupriavidus sp. UYPR2.512]UIF84723.1 GNAT family N-acetyltransferase [Cupriavidus necator]